MVNATAIKNGAEFLALATMIGFTSLMTGMAIRGKGGLVYYYEPNKAVLATEVVLGMFASAVGIVMMCKRLSRKSEYEKQENTNRRVLERSE